ncbi:MAG TPA: YkgJ family cysteine cluster protein [Polyangiaceae bacterium]
MTAPIFDRAWANQAATQAANAAFDRLQAKIDLNQVLKLIEELLAENSKLTDQFLAEPGPKVECGAGCDHCCHAPVGVTAPEALQIYTFLRRTRSNPELDALQQKLRACSDAIRGLSLNERYSPNYPCPLLEAGHCSVYPARPFACRGMNSLDRSDCEGRLHDPVRREESLTTGQGGRALINPILASQAISGGLQLALFEHFQLDMRQLDLVWALDLLFTRGTEVASEWATGGGSFEPALGASTTD